METSKRKRAEEVLAAYEHLLGRLPDGKIAEMAGVQRNTVMNYRKRLGIPAYTGHQFKPKAEREQAEPELREKQEVVMEQNEELPEEFDVPETPAEESSTEENSTEEQRAEPAEQEEAALEAGQEAEQDAAKPRSQGRGKYHRRSKLDPFVDRIGIITDREIAYLAGVTSENVRAFRMRRRIPARWRGEGNPRPNEMKILREYLLQLPEDKRKNAPSIPPGLTAEDILEGKVEESAAPAPTEQVRPRRGRPRKPLTAGGFLVTVERDGEQKEYVVVGTDIAQAARRALGGLSRLGGGPYKVVDIRYLAEALLA